MSMAAECGSPANVPAPIRAASSSFIRAIKDVSIPPYFAHHL